MRPTASSATDGVVVASSQHNPAWFGELFEKYCANTLTYATCASAVQSVAQVPRTHGLGKWFGLRFRGVTYSAAAQGQSGVGAPSPLFGLVPLAATPEPST